VTYEELQVQAAVQQALASLPVPGGVELKEYWGNYLYHIDDLPFKLSQMPPVFTQFRKLVETKGVIRPLIPVPAKLRPPPEAAGAEGEQAESKLLRANRRRGMMTCLIVV
jgi:deoxyribodipyrimidine photo-lyase